MKQITEVQWLDMQEEFPLRTLAQLSGLSPGELKLLTDYGVLQCRESRDETFYHTECLTVARTAFRLRQDLELSLEGLALVLDLLKRMQGLESELDDLRAKFPGGRD